MTKTESFNACGTKKVCLNEITINLGDQLNIQHPWFKTVDDDRLLCLDGNAARNRLCPPPHQKIVAFFGAMRNFAQALKAKGTAWFTLPRRPQKINKT